MNVQSSTRMIPARRLVWALVAAGVLGAAGGAGAMHASTALKTSLAAPATASPAEGGAVTSSVHDGATPIAGTAAPAAATLGPAALPDFAAIAARQGPAVVNISVTGSVKTQGYRRGQMPEMDPDDPFYEFFRRFQPQIPRGELPRRGQGSGFIVSQDGTILTNAHVVRDASEVTVKLTDRREFKAKVLGSDHKTDVAVLKIEAKGLPTVRLGSTQDLRVGEWVLAIGSPFGFENSVSAGVVSAKGRNLPQESFVPFLQTDVAINPGNSGGPLFNARGEVVGINSQIYSQSGGYQGLSFAIPVEVAQRVRQQIEKGGKVQHARLGITIQNVNQSIADSFKLPRPEGALVANIEEGSAGAKAGLKSGDVILKFNGQPIVASTDLPALVGQAMPGEAATLEVWRHGKLETLKATLGSDDRNARQARSDDDGAQPGKLGLALRPLDPQERRDSGVKEGLVIEDVSGPSAEAGVRPGDVLLAVNGTAVSSVEQVRSVVAGAEKSVALLVQRGRERIFLPVKLG